MVVEEGPPSNQAQPLVNHYSINSQVLSKNKYGGIWWNYGGIWLKGGRFSTTIQQLFNYCSTTIQLFSRDLHIVQ
jgi:hypothetical protein